MKKTIYEKPITVGNLLVFALPTVIMMIFTSIYTMVDGVMVSRFVGSRALSAINIVFPLVSLVSGLGFMVSTGGNAVTARKMGENKQDEANSFFTSLVVITVVFGICMSIVSVIFAKPIYIALGADDTLIDYCVEYGNIIMCGLSLFMLQIIFQMFFVTAGKPMVGLVLTILSGLTNMVFDFVLVGILDFGIKGAAYATVASYAIGGLLPFLWFFTDKMKLKFAKPVYQVKLILESMANGASEMVTSLATSVTTYLFNVKMMALAGEKGVAAITAILYIQFLFSAVMIGFTSGVAPVVSYNYGAANHENLKKLFKICIKTIAVMGVAMLVSAEVFSSPIVHVFSGEDVDMSLLAVRGLRIFSVSFLLCGFNIFGSGFFTALCNGKISAYISLLRTLVLEAPFIIAFAHFFGIDGIWLAVPVSETICIIYTVLMLVLKRKEYHY